MYLSQKFSKRLKNQKIYGRIWISCFTKKESQYQKSISKVPAPKSTTSVKYDTQSISGEYKIYYLDITQSLLEKLFNLPQPCGNFPRPLQPCDRKKII